MLSLCLYLFVCCVGGEKRVYLGLFAKNRCVLLSLEITLMRAIRVNENIKVMGWKTKAISWKLLKKQQKKLQFSVGFVTVRFILPIDNIKKYFLNLRKKKTSDLLTHELN